MYETSDLEKGTLRQVVKAVGRRWVKEFQADGMACAKAQGTSVTAAKREGEERRSTAPGSWEPGRSWGRTDTSLRGCEWEEKGGNRGTYTWRGPEAGIEKTMTYIVGRMRVLGRHEEAAREASVGQAGDQTLLEGRGPRALRGG